MLRHLSDLIRRAPAPATRAAPRLATGVELYATYLGDRGRWRVVEPSISRSGWLCREVDGPRTVHSTALDEINVIRRGAQG